MTLHRDALRPWATSAATVIALRQILGASPDGQSVAVLVLLPGAVAPETVAPSTWRDVNGRRGAVVALDMARELAAGRSASARKALDAAPAPRCVWCVALAADGAALTWCLPTAPPPAPTTPPFAGAA